MSSPGDQPPGEARSNGQGSILSGVFTGFLLVAVVLGVLYLIPAHYYVLAPGDALAVDPMISIKGFSPLDGRNHLYMTDVRLIPVDHLLEQLYWKLHPDVEFQPAQQITQGLSESQYNRLNAQFMTNSVQEAEAAALSVTRGYRLRVKDQGPQVVVTVPNTPAASVLQPGDIIASINGHPTPHSGDVAPLVRRGRPGESVRLVFLRNGRRLTVPVRTVPSTNGKPNKNGRTPLIGVSLQDKVSFVFPVKISIDAGNIGGPSAGLMFSLGIVQRLQHRDLTHGCTVAGTGTIDFTGHVGAIGGAKQKIVAARSAGARYFLVPDTPDNVGPARSAADGVKVVPVKTLRQALAYLDHLKPCR